MIDLIHQSRLEADLNVKYWSVLTRRFAGRDKISKIFLATMTSGTFASLGIWEDVEILWKLLSGLSALLAIALPILNWSETTKKLIALTDKWSGIKADYDMLSFDLNSIEQKPPDVIEKEFKKIKKKEAKLGLQKGFIFSDNKRLRDRLQNEMEASKASKIIDQKTIISNT